MAAKKKKAAARKELVLVVCAPDLGLTLGQWDERLRAFGLALEEGMTPEAWQRRCESAMDPTREDT